MEPKTTFYADVLARLRALKHGELKAVAAESGVPESTVRKLFYGEVADPRIQTVEALHNYFLSRPQRPELAEQEAPHA